MTPNAVAADVATLLLVDLSSLVHPLYAVSGNEPDPNWTAHRTVAKVRAMASRYRYAAVCADSPNTFRRDIDPTYKANRGPKNQALIHQLRLAESLLKDDGFPVWSASGFEADDVIASASAWAFEQGHRVVIASADKDLMQLVCDGVSVLNVRTETELYVPDVAQQFGVEPWQMRDYLTLVGDSSDNIKGVPGIGAKKAAAILQQFTLDELTKRIAAGESATALGLTPAIYEALKASTKLIDTARELVTLRTDATCDFAAIMQPRQPARTPEDTMNEELVDPTIVDEEQPERDPSADVTKPSTGLAKATPEVEPFTGAWERQLEPRNPADARTIAKWLHGSKLFSQYGSPEAVFSIVLAGRELGLGTMASLRGFHVVEGRPSMAADLMRALVLASGKAEYFVCKSRSAQSATWETRRKGDPCPSELTYTYGEAVTAKLTREGSGWTKHPADMLVKTASSKLCRQVYPDVTFGLYSTEELGGDD